MRFSVNHSKNFYFIFVSIILKAIHNKDYSVVKTFKAGQLAFFYLIFLVNDLNYIHPTTS